MLPANKLIYLISLVGVINKDSLLKLRLKLLLINAFDLLWVRDTIDNIGVKIEVEILRLLDI